MSGVKGIFPTGCQWEAAAGKAAFLWQADRANILLANWVSLCSGLSYCAIFLPLFSLYQHLTAIFSLFFRMHLYKRGLKTGGEILKTQNFTLPFWIKKYVEKLLEQGPQIVVYITSKVLISLGRYRSNRTSFEF